MGDPLLPDGERRFGGRWQCCSDKCPAKRKRRNGRWRERPEEREFLKGGRRISKSVILRNVPRVSRLRYYGKNEVSTSKRKGTSPAVESQKSLFVLSESGGEFEAYGKNQDGRPRKHPDGIETRRNWWNLYDLESSGLNPSKFGRSRSSGIANGHLTAGDGLSSVAFRRVLLLHHLSYAVRSPIL